MLEHDLGHVGSRLEVAAALELEQVTLGADDGALVEPFEQPFGRRFAVHRTISFVVGLGFTAPAYSSGRRSASTSLRSPSDLSLAAASSQAAYSTSAPLRRLGQERAVGIGDHARVRPLDPPLGTRAVGLGDEHPVDVRRGAREHDLDRERLERTAAQRRVHRDCDHLRSAESQRAHHLREERVVADRDTDPAGVGLDHGRRRGAGREDQPFAIPQVRLAIDGSHALPDRRSPRCCAPLRHRRARRSRRRSRVRDRQRARTTWSASDRAVAPHSCSASAASSNA